MKFLISPLFFALLSTAVLAHAPLTKTTPENGAQLADAPTEIVLHFAKRMRLTRVQLTLENATSVDLEIDGNQEFATQFTIPLPTIGRGTYSVEWRGLAIDGHIMNEGISFQVQ